MTVQDVEIPECVIAALTSFIASGRGVTLCAVTAEATRQLLKVGITDPKRQVPDRLADRLLQRMRSQGQIHFVRDGKMTRWFPCEPMTLH